MRLTSFFLLFIGATCSLAAQVNLDSGLIRSYPFSGNANDVSVSNDHAVVSGPVLTSDRFGNANSAYLFDGLNDIITFDPNGCELQEFTYSIWAYIPDYSDTTSNDTTDTDSSSQKHGAGVGVYALMYIGSTTDDHGITTGGQGTNWAVGSYHHNGGMHNAFSGIAPNFNEWHHLVLTRTPNSLKIYVDGVLAETTALPNKTAGYRDAVVAVIGARPEYYAYFKGKLDDVRVYGRAINDAEVAELFNLSSSMAVAAPDAESGLILYPNPLKAGQELNLLFENKTIEIRSVSVYSISGQLIHTYPANQNWIAGNWTPGTYILRIETPRGAIEKKFILNP